jgi:rubrerythrin
MAKNGSTKKSAGFEALMYQLLETELGGEQVYTKAIELAINDDLKEEWQKYLSETQEHVKIARQLLQDVGLDPDQEVAAREPVRIIGEGLLAAMTAAKKGGSPAEAELVAAECVVEAETKDHMNWHLVKALAEKSTGDVKKALTTAVEQVEPQEDHHLYHTKGWARELWLQAIGLPAVLPPPEEVKQVSTAIGAARAEQQRKDLL